MLAPVLALLAVWVVEGVVFLDRAKAFVLGGAADFQVGRHFAAEGVETSAVPLLAWLPGVCAVVIAALDLNRHRFTDAMVRRGALLVRPAYRALQVMHDGVIGDYVLWMMAGMVFLAGVAMIG